MSFCPFVFGNRRLRWVSLLVGVLSWPLAIGINAQSDANIPPTPNWALTANMLQVMRAVYFPMSNTIFNVQSNDPAEKKPAGTTRSGSGAFDWIQWGANLYSGWDYVEYAAAMLAESSPLLLTPGRLCSNGKPVPVDRPDWVKYTTEMLAAARKSYQLSLTKNREAVADSTEALSNACQSCHRVYRDRRAPGGQPGNPASVVLRCTPP